MNLICYEQFTKASFFKGLSLLISRSVFIFFLGGFSLLLSNTSGRVTGKVVDEETKNPLEYANVVVYGIPDSVFVTGTSTDKDGFFVIGNLSPGKYSIEISYLGYLSKKITNIEITASGKDLGKITLKKISLELNEVVVEAKKPMLISFPGKLMLNVDQNIIGEGGSAIDLMQNIPSVTIDEDNNIFLRGRKATIMIDGIQTNIEDVLDQLPATSIESIEVITNPSAKYDTKSGVGVINIKLRKEKRKGLNGRIQFSVFHVGDYNGVLSLNYRYKKFNIFSSYSGQLKTQIGKTQSRRAITKKISSFLNQNIESNRKLPGHIIRLRGSYFINKTDLITFGGYYHIFDQQYNTFYENQKFNSDHEIAYFSKRDRKSNLDRNSYEFSFKYKKQFKKDKQEFVIAAVHNKTFSFQTVDQFNQNYNIDSTRKGNQKIEQILTDEKKRLSSIQLDYSHPISKKCLLETGYKLSYVKNNLLSGYNDYDNESGLWIENLLRSNNFDYEELMNGIYFMLSFQFHEFNYMIGSRFEKVFLKPIDKFTQLTYENKYFNILPSFQIGRNLTKTQSISFSYSKRVNPPPYRKLNPYIIYSNPYFIRSGNPALRPEYIHSFEVAHSFINNHLTLNSTLFYKRIFDIIGTLVEVDEDGVTNSTSANLSEGSSLGVELISSVDIRNFWNFKINLTCFNSVINNRTSKNSGKHKQIVLISKLFNDLRLLSDYKLQIISRYNSPRITWAGKTYGQFSVDLGIKRDFLKNKGSIILKITDVFNTLKYEKEITNREDFTSFISTKYDTRRYMVSLNYKFFKTFK